MPIYIDVKSYYETTKNGKLVTKNGKLVRRKDIEKEVPTLFLRRQPPPQKRPIEQNENIPPSEPLTDKEVEEIRNDILQHPAFNLFEDSIRFKIIFGDIAYPKEYDKFIDQESNISEMVVKSQVAILAKETAYLALHLSRWIHEEIKEGDVIAEWYKKAPLPFTHRTMAPTNTSYEIIKQILYMRGELSHLRNDFKPDYERLLEVAGKCDIERPKWFRALPVKPINDFKSAAVKFLEIVKIINSEANIALGKLTQEKAGQGNKKKPGRPKKHSEDKIKAAQTLFDKLQGKGKSVNECWFEVHQSLGFESAIAAKQAVYRFKKQNKKQK